MICYGFLYSIDQPTNLFPSIHCLVSWFCFIGIKDREDIPKWYKVFSCIFAIMVFVSTQVTKQHYLVDVVGGVLIAELTFRISRRVGAYLYVQRFYEKINSSIARQAMGNGGIRLQSKKKNLLHIAILILLVIIILSFVSG